MGASKGTKAGLSRVMWEWGSMGGACTALKLQHREEATAPEEEGRGAGLLQVGGLS